MPVHELTMNVPMTAGIVQQLSVAAQQVAESGDVFRIEATYSETYGAMNPLTCHRVNCLASQVAPS